MVQIPPHDPVDRQRRKPGRAPVLGLAVLVIGGFVVFTQLTAPPPPPQAAPTTIPPVPTAPTTTIRPTVTIPPIDMAAAEMGPRFEFSRQLQLDEGQWPIALIEHDGHPLLFIAEESDRGVAHGLTVIQPDAQGGDDRVMAISDEYAVANVISSPFGLVAYGFEFATGHGMTWLSSDGRNWEPLVVAEGDPDHARWFEFGVASDRMVVIAGYTYGLNRADLDIKEALEQYLGFPIDNFGRETSFAGETRFSAFGPLGVLVGTATTSELGLSEADVVEVDSEISTTLWASTNGTTWTALAEPGHVQRWGGYAAPDGRVWYHQWAGDNEGQTSVVAVDVVNGLINSEVVTLTPNPAWSIGQRSGWLFGQHTQGPALSRNGVDWRGIALEQLLPSGVSWSTTNMDVGETGVAIAVYAHTWASYPPMGSSEVSWRDGDLTVTVTVEQITLESAGRTVRIPLWHQGTASIPSGRIDPITGDLILLDPDTGEDLVVLARLAVARIEREMLDRWDNPYQEYQALIFTTIDRWPVPGQPRPDFDEGWTVQDLTLSVGHASHLLVGADRLYLVASTQGTHSLWMGLIPDRP